MSSTRSSHASLTRSPAPYASITMTRCLSVAERAEQLRDLDGGEHHGHVHRHAHARHLAISSGRVERHVVEELERAAYTLNDAGRTLRS